MLYYHSDTEGFKQKLKKYRIIQSGLDPSHHYWKIFKKGEEKIFVYHEMIQLICQLRDSFPSHGPIHTKIWKKKVVLSDF